jgi:hypothetical protein
MALAICMHIELQTGAFIKKYLSESKKISDARMLNALTGKEIRIRAATTKDMAFFEQKLIHRTKCYKSGGGHVSPELFGGFYALFINFLVVVLVFY